MGRDLVVRLYDSKPMVMRISLHSAVGQVFETQLLASHMQSSGLPFAFLGLGFLHLCKRGAWLEGQAELQCFLLSSKGKGYVSRTEASVPTVPHKVPTKTDGWKWEDSQEM